MSSLDAKFIQIAASDEGDVYALDVDGVVWRYHRHYTVSDGWAKLETVRYPIPETQEVRP